MKEGAFRREIGAVRRPQKAHLSSESAFRANSCSQRRAAKEFTALSPRLFLPNPAKDVIGFRVVEKKRPRIITCHETFHSGPAVFWHVAAGEENGRNHNDCFPFSPSRASRLLVLCMTGCASLVLWLKDMHRLESLLSARLCVAINNLGSDPSSSAGRWTVSSLTSF